MDTMGNIYIEDGPNFRIRKIDTSGIISTYAGNGTPGFSGDGAAATNAQINNVQSGIAIDRSGNLYVSDDGVLRKAWRIACAVIRGERPARFHDS